MSSSDVSRDSEVFSIKEFFESMQIDITSIKDIPEQNGRNVEGKDANPFQILSI